MGQLWRQRVGSFMRDCFFLFFICSALIDWIVDCDAADLVGGGFGAGSDFEF